MNYEQAKAAKAALQAVVDDASADLKKFPRGPMGMILDEVKFTPECMDAKARYASAFRGLQEFNERFVKEFATEYRAERRQRYSGDGQ
jgi:hypothetical protein